MKSILTGMIRCLVTLLIAGGLISESAFSATITWTNAAGGNWSTPANWGTGTVPGPDDDAIITVAGNYTVAFDTNVSVNNLTVGGASGTQTFLWAASNLSVANFTIYTNASFNLAPGATLNLGGVINSWGTINWGTTNAMSGLTNCTINSYGVFNLQTNFNTSGFSYVFQANGIAGALNSSGTFLLQSNLGTVVFLPDMLYFTNSGTISVGTNSILALQSKINTNPSYYVTSVPMTFNDGTLISGTGVVQNTNSDLNANGSITVNGTFELDGAQQPVPAVIQGTQTWTGSGSFIWNGGIIGDPVNSADMNISPTNITSFDTNFNVYEPPFGAMVVNSQIINNQGTITMNASAFLQATANESIINNIGLLVLQGHTFLSVANAGFPQSVLNNTGVILASGASSLLNVESGWIVTNVGTIEVATNATLDLESTVTNGFAFGDGTVLNAWGQLSFAQGHPSSLVASGTIIINGPSNAYGNFVLGQGYVSGTQTWTGDGSLGLDGATFYGPGTTTIATNFQVLGPVGVGDYALSLDGHELDDYGTVTGDVLNIANGAQPAMFVNIGTIVVGNFLGLFPADGQETNNGSSFVNLGLIRVYPKNSRQLQSLWNVTNYGTIEVDGPYFEIDAANLTLNDGSVFSGSGQIALNYSPVEPNVPGTITANGNITVNNPNLSIGSLTLLQGTQTWSGSGSLTWSSGAMVQPGTTTVATNFTLYLTNDPVDYSPWLGPNLYSRTLAQNHALDNYGTIIWNTTNAVVMTNQAAFINNSLVLLETNCALQQATSDCTFNNSFSGIVRNLGGPSVFNCLFANDGALEFMVGGPSTALTVPRLNPNGILRVTVPNGYVPTNGAAFALVNYNSISGTFANTQLPSLPPDLKWNLNYGATSLTLEAVASQTRISAPKILSDGTFQFNFSGPPGNSYIIQASTNLVNWVTLQTNSAFSGQVDFVDTTATNFGRRFYRGIIGL